MADAPTAGTGRGGTIATVSSPTASAGGRGHLGDSGSGISPGGSGGVPGGSTPVPGPAAGTADQLSAKAMIDAFMANLGLTGLGDWGWQKVLAGDSVNQILLELKGTQEYKDRFPGMEELDKRGWGGNEASYISYENNVRSMLHAAGVPAGIFDDPAHIASMLLNNVDLSEAKARIDDSVAATLTQPASVRAEFAKAFGVAGDQGAMTALWLDSSKALPVLQRQLALAQVSGAAIDQGLGVDAATAARLADQGIGYNQALQGFGTVAQTQALGSGLGSETADQATRTAAAFGDAAAQNTVTRVIKGRLVADQGGGRLAEATTGVTGLASAATT